MGRRPARQPPKPPASVARGRWRRLAAAGLPVAVAAAAAASTLLWMRGLPGVAPRPSTPNGGFSRAVPAVYDLVLQGGTILDGSGGEPRRADVGISGDRIAAVGDLSNAPGHRVLRVTGRYVAPGFINPHSHVDGALSADPQMAASLLQGITTEIVGMDGESPVDLPAFVSALEASEGFGVNLAVLVGHGAVRRAVMGHEARPATPSELQRMGLLVRAAMEAGALGLSTGLEYVPGRYAPTAELVQLARIVAEYGGVYVSHIRNERDRILAAVQEALEIGRLAGVPVHISHLKVARKPGWPAQRSVLVALARQVSELIAAARAAGQAVTADLYPYPVPWYLTRRPFSQAYPAYPLETLEPVLEELDTFGQTLADLASQWGTTPEQAAARLRRAYGDFPVAIHSVDEEVIRLLLAQPFTMVGVDAPPAGDPRWGGTGHPRGYGTYPRVLGRYVRELRRLTWPEAVHKMTGMVAETFGLEGRGLVGPGHFADLVVFDPATVRDRATYVDPRLAPTGVEHVIVNGRLAVENGQLVGPALGAEAAAGSGGVRAGRVLRRRPGLP